ncbi:isopentenyl transferase family protein [Actinoplanes sp. NPDC089786]|uniref:isopentenyl transferase family protein n=1 Tax=Actinoplanes sp. NPDC089786 TaxID=3155185 RepID=UPI00343798AA
MIVVNEVPRRQSVESAVDILPAKAELGLVREIGGVGIHPRALDQDSGAPEAIVHHDRRLNLILIVGPTGVGKTDRAIELARKVDAPIVVLDRVQCYAELAVGSARDDGGGRTAGSGPRRAGRGQPAGRPCRRG